MRVWSEGSEGWKYGRAVAAAAAAAWPVFFVQVG